MSRSLIPLNLCNTLYSTWEISLDTNTRIQHYPNWRDKVCDFWAAKGYELDCGPDNSWYLPDKQLIIFLLTYGT